MRADAETQLQVVCRVCVRQYSKYHCPRCRLPYCSLACYKSHGPSCTESFYRDQAVAELKQMKSSDEDRRNVMGMLERHHRSCEMDAKGTTGGEGTDDADREHEDDKEEEEDNEDKEGTGEASSSILSEATLDKILSRISRAQQDFTSTQDPSSAAAPSLDFLLSSLDLQDLDPDELAALHRAAVTGHLSYLIEPWVPWWTSAEAKGLRLGAGGTALITLNPPGAQREGGGESDLPSSSSGLPLPPSVPLPPVSALTSQQPSAMLRYHILDILFSYCLVLRTFNGDAHSPESVLDASSLLLSVSSCLTPARPPSTPLPPSASEALMGCVDRSCRPPAGDVRSRGLALLALTDVPVLLLLSSDSNQRGSCGRSALILALCDMSRIIEETISSIPGSSESGELWMRRKGQGRGRGGGAASIKAKKDLVAAGRKLRFLCSWANEQDEASITSLGEEAEVISSQCIQGQAEEGSEPIVNRNKLHHHQS